MTKQHRERETARCTKHENKGHGSTFLKHVFNTGREKGQAIHHDQNTSLAEELTNSTAYQRSVRKATLTDVLNTQPKDQKQARLINVLMFSTRITKMWRCFVNQAASSHSVTICSVFLLTEIVFEFFFSSVIISARMVCKNRSRIARQIIASEATERRSASTSRFEERCVRNATSGKQSDV